MNAISCLKWVKRGIVSSNPSQAAFDETKLKNLVSQHNHDSEDEGPSTSMKRKKPNKSTANPEDKRIVDNYDLDNYSDDDKGSDDENDGCFGMSNLAVFTNDEKDPYMTKYDDSDDEDLIIESDDNLILAGKVDGDFSSLEVWVYNEARGNDGMFCHHEYILPSLPLCVEYVGGIEGKNLAAVGSMDGSLAFWNLDVMDTLDADYVINGCKAKKSLKQKAKKSKSSSSNAQKAHSDAILNLSWNEIQTNILASASVDKTIGLWDLNALPQCCFLTGVHSEKIQSLQWHPCEAQTILTGSSDKTVKVFDCRTHTSAKSWEFSGEVEKVLWHASSPFCFFTGTSTGSIHYVDIRMNDHVYELDAHTPDSVTDLTIVNASSGNCLLSSTDKGIVKVWDISKENKLVNSKNYKIGSVFCLSACPDSSKPIFAMGGENEMKVSNLFRDVVSSEAFGWTFEGRVKTSDNIDDKKVKKGSKVKKGKSGAGPSTSRNNEASKEQRKKFAMKKAKDRMSQKKKAKK